jgi:hypothetical protein
MKRVHEKIMISLLALSVIGFLIAPCCWNAAPKKDAKHVIACSDKTNTTVVRQQKINRDLSKGRDKMR